MLARTNIVLDTVLTGKAMQITGAHTKREVVDLALRALVRQRQTYGRLRALRGQLSWDGDLNVLRRDRIASR